MINRIKNFINQLKARHISTLLGALLICYFIFLVIAPVVYVSYSLTSLNNASDHISRQMCYTAKALMSSFTADGLLEDEEKKALDIIPGHLTIMRNKEIVYSSVTDNVAAGCAPEIVGNSREFNFYYYYEQPINSMSLAIIPSIVFFIAFMCAIYIAIVMGIYKPILKIERVLNGAVHGETDFDFTEKSTGNTLSSIFSDLQLLIDKMRSLMLRESTAQLMKKQAELDALQSQINPHFLYNTLDAIRGQASARGLNDVELMALSLSQLFRYSISNHDTFVALEEELANIENYLLIQNLRFDNKFRKISSIDSDTLTCKIPKLLIQPLVENAVHHRLEPKVSPGTIKISAYRTSSRLIISIKDDGLGLPNDKLIEINDMLRNNTPITDETPTGEKRRSVGLSNVNSRIRLLFGDEYGLTFFSTENVGTEVQLTMPVVD